jgi:hypothetical protein
MWLFRPIGAGPGRHVINLSDQQFFLCSTKSVFPPPDGQLKKLTVLVFTFITKVMAHYVRTIQYVLQYHQGLN